MKIVHMASDGYTEYNSGNFRASMSSNALRDAGHQVAILSIHDWLRNTEIVKRVCADADIIIVHRVMVDDSIRVARYWEERGVKVVADFDDGYKQLTMDSGNPAVDFWIQGNVQVSSGAVSYKKKAFDDPIKEFEKGLSQITGALVPSKVLADDYKHAARMWYLPNYIDSSFYLDVEKKEHDGLIIGGGWSLGHLESIRESGIIEGLRRTLYEHRHVKLMIVGDDRIIKMLPLPQGQLIFRPYVMFKDWPQTYASFDISIAPLHGAFDMRRSFIKAGEACLMRTPLIATGDDEYPVYEHFFDCPSHIYVPSERTVPDKADREEAWYDALTEMIVDHDHYIERANTRGFEMGMDIDTRNNVDNILAVYEEILETP